MAKIPTISVAAAVAVVLALPAAGAAPDAAAIQKALLAEYHLTKTTDDRSDIVTAGSVLELHKDKVLMVAATSTANPCMNTYKDGRITATKACGVSEKIKRFGRFIPGAGNAPSLTTRNFVSGEKFWVTGIDVQNNGVIFHFFTDAINDTRYISSLTIPFGALAPTPDEALKVVREVITVVPDENQQAQGNGAQPSNAGPQQPNPAPQQTAAAAKPEAAPPPLDIPPPPPADPVEVKVGETTAQVVAALGQPAKKAKPSSSREIYFYRDLKITFVNGKVKDVE